MSPDDEKKLGDLLIAGGSDALIPELEKLKGTPPDELGDLLVFLAPLGGTKWPSVLHSLGANLDFVDDEGQTALSQCVHAQSGLRSGEGGADTFATAVELLDLGADPNASYLSMFSVTALAARHNLPEFVALFLLAGADLYREEPDSQTQVTLKEKLLSLEAEWPRRIVAIVERKRPCGAASVR